MATTGTVTLKTESVDYNGGGAYTRGYRTLTNIIRWTVDDTAHISFSLVSTTTTPDNTWGICTSGSPYYIELVPQVSYSSGGGWTSLDTKRHLVTEICGSGYTDTVAMSAELIGQLGSYQLTGNCQLRFLYYMTVAPAPSASFPNAFPNSSYSSQSQVPVDIEVDYRPGAILDGVWKSHNRSAGTAHIYDGTKWVEMKTSDGHSASENPPSINDGTKWVNQNKIGQE